MKNFSSNSDGYSMMDSLPSRVGGGGGGQTYRDKSRWYLGTSLLEARTGAGPRVGIGGAVLTTGHWLSAVVSFGWRAMCLLLMLFSLSLIVSCGGGSGDGNSGNGLVGDLTPPPFINASLEIIPSGDHFNITLHNYRSLTREEGVRGINITVTAVSSNRTQFIPLLDLILEKGSFVLADLMSGEAYSFAIALIYDNGSRSDYAIDFYRDDNREDHAGGGIYLGPNRDRDGQADDVDTDYDNDGIKNNDDLCRQGIVGWLSNPMNDRDRDGCRDDGEDLDDDNDNLLDNHTIEQLVNRDGISCSLLDDCDGDRLLDNDTREQQVNADSVFCSLLVDCDGDSLLDNDTREQFMNANGVSCSLLVDCDGDSVVDVADAFPIDPTETVDTDGDGTGNDADTDDDGDRLLDTDAQEQLMNTDGIVCSLLVDCDGDSLFDNHTTEQLVNRDGVSCAVLRNCDNDYLEDSEDLCPAGEQDWNNDDGNNDDDRDGCRNDEDIDGDGDGLIEIATAEELNAVRYDLNGTGFKRDEGAVLNTTGCGNGEDINECSGYELMQNISLTDYIAGYNATAGWLPIAADINQTNNACDGDTFTGIFDGNSFEVRDLFINRSTERCVGLFGQVDGTIRRLGVQVDAVIGGDRVGGLVGDGGSATIVESFVMGGMVQGTSHVGGLMGDGGSATIVESFVKDSSVQGTSRVGGLVGEGSSATIDRSYAASDTVSGSGDRVGGLVGHGDNARIVQSYAVNDEVMGNHRVGGLVGNAAGADITRSYAVSGEVMGNQRVGGLVGGSSRVITQSYAVSREVRGNGFYVGGLIGHGNNAKIVQSYAVGSKVWGNTGDAGGLAGIGWSTNIIQSYGVIEDLHGSVSVGGFIGDASDSSIIHSYAVNGRIRGSSGGDGAVGIGEDIIDRSSYWDAQTSGHSGGSVGGTGKNTNELRLPTGYTGIYGRWDDGTTVGGVDKNSTIWCDTDSSGSVEEDEKQDSNWVWDFGTTTDYPALRCTEGGLVNQRAWWYLNITTNKPNLNKTRLDAWLDGSLP